FGGWKLYQSQVSVPIIELTGDAQAQPAYSSSIPRFRCDGREYCSQMTSRAEAEFFTRNCPNSKMDGDGDGVPCENDSRF
ncbi:excalibur calcium-binding domain-containing protein, partial [Candidatus Kaiserbacteria bacterium]|nr:excalibur calcium-binding domain-containing protein [Candidatus Kaiserbacteria bacterium]